TFSGQPAHADLSLVSRAVATKDLSLEVTVAVYSTGRAARRALGEATSTRHLDCMLAWIKLKLAEGWDHSLYLRTQGLRLRTCHDACRTSNDRRAGNRQKQLA